MSGYWNSYRNYGYTHGYGHGEDDYGYLDLWGVGRDWDSHEDGGEEDDIEFYRPDGTYEGKTPTWCRGNGFFQVGENEWSGKWYWEHFPERKEQWKKERAEIQQEQEQRAQEMEVMEQLALECERREIDDLLMPRRYDCNHKCLLQRCNDRFSSIEERDHHVRFHQGKGHARYREQYGICQLLEGPIFVPNPSSPPLVRRKQTDIRSFFGAPTTGKNLG